MSQRNLMLIDGHDHAATTGRWLVVRNSATGETVAEVPAGAAADVELAVAAAKREFDTGDWPRMTASQRSRS